MVSYVCCFSHFQSHLFKKTPFSLLSYLYQWNAMKIHRMIFVLSFRILFKKIQFFEQYIVQCSIAQRRTYSDHIVRNLETS